MTAFTTAAVDSGLSEPRWKQCRRCGSTLFRQRLERELQVCPDCGNHMRLRIEQRLDHLLDAGSWQPESAQPRSVDPLGFVDSRPYAERLREAVNRTALPDAAVLGRARLADHRICVLAMDFAFLGGSMGSAVGEAVTRAAERSLESREPLVLIVASGGARMQEGALSLMQMAKTAQAMHELRASGVLSIAVLTDPTFGGVTASFATLADVLVGEKGALIGFAGPRVIRNAVREELPAGFQTAEYLLGAGLLDRVESRQALRPLLARLLDLAGRPTVVAQRSHDVGAPQLPKLHSSRAASETVRMARDVGRPTMLDYVGHMCEDWLELHGDRVGGDDPAIVGGLASIEGHRMILLGHQKGHDTAERVARNFGMPQPAGYRKALRLMQLADRLRLPVVTLVDTQGAAPGIEAERNGQAWSIAECIAGMSALRVPVVSIVTGEGGSGGAIALAVANRVLMLENACYSVISPESCSTILHGNPSRGDEMAEALRLTAPALLSLGVVDGVVAEGAGGTQADHPGAAARLKAAVLHALAQLAELDGEELRLQRRDRFRAMGVVDV